MSVQFLLPSRSWFANETSQYGYGAVLIIGSNCNRSFILVPIVALAALLVGWINYHVLCASSYLHLNIQVYDYILCIPDSASGHPIWATDYLWSQSVQIAYIVESRWGLGTLLYLVCTYFPFFYLLMDMFGVCHLCISVVPCLIAWRLSWCSAEIFQPNASSTVWASDANIQTGLTPQS